MEIVFNTTSDDKDHDTRLEIFIVPKIGLPAVAYLDIGGGNQPHVPNQHFGNNSSAGPFIVPTFGSGFTLNDLPNEEILLKITPNGHDTWVFGFDATLHFDDGTTAKISMAPGSITLHQAPQEWDRNSEVRLSGATVTKPS